MKLEIEVDQNKWHETASEIPFAINEVPIPCASIYDHEEYIYRIIYDWDMGIYTIIRPCGQVVCCVVDSYVAQAIVELIAQNKP